MNYEKKIKTFQDLYAWQESHKFVLQIYDLTKNFPKAEQFSLTSQLRRAAVSVTSNISEGFGRSSFKEKVHFYNMASASLTECQNQIIIAFDVKYIDSKKFDSVWEQSLVCSKLINGLTKETRRRSNVS